MYVSNQLGYYGGLGHTWGDSESLKVSPDQTLKPTDVVSASQMIPKKHAIINADQASDVLAQIQAPLPKPQARGDVYWTPEGPKFSKTQIADGKKMAYVEPPKIQNGPFVKMIRDLPKLNLSPIKIKLPSKKSLHGLGELTAGSPVVWLGVLGVLGLIFLGVRHYNMAS